MTAKGRLAAPKTALTLMALIHLVALVGATASAPPRDWFRAGAEPVADGNLLDPIVERYAPIVYLHSSENYPPGDPSDFISRSRLVWAHDESCRDHVIAEHVDAAALGAGRYFHRHSQRRILTCRHRGPLLNSVASVRPRTRESGEEGFFLDLQDDELRRGNGRAAPVLFYHLPHRYVAYWFFYPYNDGGVLDHDGDWENIVVRFGEDDRPTEVAFFAHGHASIYPWDALTREGSHPVVYSALGSHASFPTIGTHIGLPNIDFTNRGQRWESAAVLRNVLREPWWGYGGAWGQVGEMASTTGPKGPSPFKLGVPLSWSAPIDFAAYSSTR